MVGVVVSDCSGVDVDIGMKGWGFLFEIVVFVVFSEYLLFIIELITCLVLGPTMP